MQLMMDMHWLVAVQCLPTYLKISLLMSESHAALITSYRYVQSVAVETDSFPFQIGFIFTVHNSLHTLAGHEPMVSSQCK